MLALVEDLVDMAVLLNPETNNGYYFEIVALTETNIESIFKM
jgi:hypothetical protein